MKRISAFLSHKTGYEVVTYLLKDEKSRLNLIFLKSKDDFWSKKIYEYLISKDFDKKNIFFGKDEWERVYTKHQSSKIVLTVYWPWILPKNAYEFSDVTCNFHPALLPLNRGWYPHVYNLINGSTPGVSLHELAEGADTGKILAQKAVHLRPTDTAYEIYLRLQLEIVDLFYDNWSLIRDKKIKSFKQDNLASSYNSKSEIEKLDFINLDEICKTSDLLNKLRARSFGKRGFAYSIQDGRKIFYRIQLSDTSNFDTE